MKKLTVSNIDFVGRKKLFYTISIVALAVGLLVNIIFGTKLDIQFTGGTIMTYSYSGEYNEAAVRESVTGLTSNTEVGISEGFDTVTNLNRFTITLPSKTSMDEQTNITDSLLAAMPNSKVELVTSNSVDPTIGKDFLVKGILAIAVASVFMIIYVTFRFRNIGGFSAGCMAVIALLHDILIVYFVFIVFRIQINDNFIAVVLTILGYSINDTIVIYDRIRENQKLETGKKKYDYSELVNKSLNQSMKRTLMTSITTFIAVACIVIVAAIANLTSIMSFAVPMLFGIASGAYTSLCIAPTLWTTWKMRKAKSSL